MFETIPMASARIIPFQMKDLNAATFLDLFASKPNLKSLRGNKVYFILVAKGKKGSMQRSQDNA